jgi:hypothetical protein
MIGETISRYRIPGQFGAGGMESRTRWMLGARDVALRVFPYVGQRFAFSRRDSDTQLLLYYFPTDCKPRIKKRSFTNAITVVSE